MCTYTLALKQLGQHAQMKDERYCGLLKQHVIRYISTVSTVPRFNLLNKLLYHVLKVVILEFKERLFNTERGGWGS